MAGKAATIVAEKGKTLRKEGLREAKNETM